MLKFLHEAQKRSSDEKADFFHIGASVYFSILFLPKRKPARKFNAA